MNLAHQQRKLVIDVGFPSACYEYILLPLVYKQCTLAYGRAEYIARQKHPSRDRGEKKEESGRCHVAAKGEKHGNLTCKPQPCDDT